MSAKKACHIDMRGKGKVQSTALPETLWRDLYDVAQNEGVSPSALIRIALRSFLAQYRMIEVGAENGETASS